MTSFINPFDLDQTTNRVITLIPARYQSSRLPGKPLIDIAGKSMIQRTYTQASKAKLTTDLIYVVTDNQEIEDHVKSWNGRVLRVDQECLNGTERIAKSISCLELDPKINDSDIVLNVQGDEPFIDPENIDFLRRSLNSSLLLELFWAPGGPRAQILAFSWHRTLSWAPWWTMKVLIFLIESLHFLSFIAVLGPG